MIDLLPQIESVELINDNKYYSRSTLYGIQNTQPATYQGHQPVGFNFAANTRQAEGNFQG